eukprot:NODE_178_length_14069_cov_0.746815.p14 type:complete len:109 gc:universal NODE_178_length_14069_cov_0.746815:6271-6597(+)
MSTTIIDSKADRTEEENRMAELSEMESGPFKIIMAAIKLRKKILISLRNNKKIIGTPKAVDRHCNLVIENATEMWIEHLNNEPKRQERFISKLFVRGDGIIIVVEVTE